LVWGDIAEIPLSSALYTGFSIVALEAVVDAESALFGRCVEESAFFARDALPGLGFKGRFASKASTSIIAFFAIFVTILTDFGLLVKVLP